MDLISTAILTLCKLCDYVGRVSCSDELRQLSPESAAPLDNFTVQVQSHCSHRAVYVGSTKQQEDTKIN